MRAYVVLEGDRTRWLQTAPTWWEGDESKGEMRRIGFEASARIDRHDFGVSWQDELPGGGLVVSNEIELSLHVEAILVDDLERTGAIDYYLRGSQER